MGAGHAHALYVHEHTLLHHLAPEAKLAAAFLFVVAVALSPPQAIWAFIAFGTALLFLVRLARVRLRFVAGRLLVIVPFILFALFIPFIGSGEQTEVLGMSLSVEGLWSMWNIIAKASIGATVSILLAATTEIPDIVRGMGRLKVPAVLVSIATFMIRYLEVIAGELGRMRVAMTARGYDPRWLWQAKPIAASAGALFIRSYERGERVYDAMLARGYTGAMPDLGHRHATGRDWAIAAALPLFGIVVALAAGVLT